MINSDKLLKLTHLLENTNVPLSQLSLRQIPDTLNFVSLDLTLYLLLQDNLFASTCQKLIAYYLLYEYNLSETEINPYLPFILDVARNDSPTEDWERNFCYLLLTGQSKDVRFSRVSLLIQSRC